MRRLSVVLVATLFLGACGASSAPTDGDLVSTDSGTTQPAASFPVVSATDASAPEDFATDASAPEDFAPEDFAPEDVAPNTIVTPSADQIDIDRPVINDPGTTSLVVLTKAEICSLVAEDEPQGIWGLSTKLTLTGWTQTDSSSSCSHIFNNEPGDGGTKNVGWELSSLTRTSWPKADTDYKRTVRDTTVAALPTRIVSSEPSDLGTKDLDVYVAVNDTVSLQVTVYGDDSMFDEAKLLTQAERIIGRLPSLKLNPEPAKDAQVDNVFQLTAGQLCSLLRDSTAASLLVDGWPSGTSSYLLFEDYLSCSIGSAKLGVAVRSVEPFSIDETTKSPAKVGSRAGVWDKPSLEGGKADPGADVQFVSLLVKWREVWIEVDARLVQNTPEVERLVLDEMTHVLAQLDASVQQ